MKILKKIIIFLVLGFCLSIFGQSIESKIEKYSESVYAFPTQMSINEFKDFLKECSQNNQSLSIKIYCEAYMLDLELFYEDLSPEKYIESSSKLVQKAIDQGVNDKFSFHAVLNLIHSLDYLEGNQFHDLWNKVFAFVKLFELKDFQPKFSSDETYLMADVLKSYGELYFYKDDLEKAEKFHSEALALWEIHSEENDWKILNQIRYLVEVFNQQGNLTDRKTFSAKLYESNSNLNREYYRLYGLYHLFLAENFYDSEDQYIYADQFIKDYLKLLRTNFWDDMLAGYAEEIFWPFLTNRECGADTDISIELVQEILDIHSKFRSQQALFNKFLDNQKVNRYRDIEIPLNIHYCLENEEDTLTLAENIKIQIELWLDSSDKHSFEELYWSSEYAVWIFHDLNEISKKELLRSFFSKAIELEKLIEENSYELIRNVRTVIDSIFFSLKDLSSEEVSQAFKLGESLIKKLPNNLNYHDLDFALLYENLTSYTAEAGFFKQATFFQSLLDKKYKNEFVFDPFSITQNNSLKRINESKLGLEALRVFEEQEFDTNEQLSILNSLLKNEFEVAIYKNTLPEKSTMKLFLEEYIRFGESVSKSQEINFLDPNLNKLSILEAIPKMDSLAKKLSPSEIIKLQKFILPDVDLKTLQESMSEEELLIILYFFPLYEDEYLLALAVDKENDEVVVQPFYEGGFYNFLEEIRYELSSEEFLNYPSQSLLEFSDIIFADFKKIMQEKKSLHFISNFPESFTPSILFFAEKPLIMNFEEIHTHFNFSDFLRKDTSGSRPNNYFGFGNVDYSKHKNTYSSLPETEEEIAFAAKILDLKNSVFFKENAHENNLPRQTSNSIIHFATHNSTVLKDKLQIPALVLSKNSFSDGYLDIFEISKGKYLNSDILLSACSTEESFSGDSDSFSGLVKSFTLAGAKSVLATAWPVESNSTSIFIQSYLKKLSEGKNYGVALNEAKLEFFKSDNYAHPLFWAPFSVYAAR